LSPDGVWVRIAYVTSALTLDRVRHDVAVLARSGLVTEEFVAEVSASLSRALPNAALCLSMLDPATTLLTRTFKFGEMAAPADGDVWWALYEYGSEDPEPSAISEMIKHRVSAMAVSMRDDPAQSPRLRNFIHPHLGFTDELRILAVDAEGVWGGLSLFRRDTDAPFSEAEVEWAARVAAPLAAGLRASLVVAYAAGFQPGADGGPAVIVIGSDDSPRLVSPGAADMVARFVDDSSDASTRLVIPALLGQARRYAAGHTELPACTRVRLSDGRWLVLHASPLSGRDGYEGEVVVTIDEARPPEVLPLIVSAFGLTAREQNVVELVIRGVDTKEIASTLHMSAYTVQDHLKSIFAKVDVRSRRELIVRTFLGQYAPRLGGAVGPSGWFIGAGPDVPAAD
jgi:DNA-binding CsgD family transcriptional regulator